MIIVITGPTGVGKTKMSVELAKRVDAEIINADSMQVYKNLDIATAKIKEEEKDNVPHHLFDIVEKEENYTVYDYQKDCRKTINEIASRNKNIIIVGGTGLYIKAALYNYNFNEESNTYDFSNMTNEELYNKIKETNPNINVHINNRKRLERDLTKINNNTISDGKGNEIIYPFNIIGLTTNRDELYNRINKRVELMVEEGLIEEARDLYNKNINSKAIMTGIGYKELYKYFDGDITLEEALELIKRNSRRYAKRQYTFFNNQFNMNWFEVNYDNFNETIDEVYKFITKED
ncbi:MAG: tRNA (adenosine(37)-N6)-dimethylallyltransferase MiaA [Bacilli bacterium]|nr:tRNA (adenosine(37)-N6)-dimethylallyltransferase MiaA [Bacilli bacterium]